MFSEFSNNDRADIARTVTTQYMATKGSDDDLETGITDLLADLMHLCAAQGVDFERALGLAREHFNAEVIDDAAVAPFPA